MGSIAERGPAAEPMMPRFTRWLRPGVDAVARSRLSVHRKLLFGFLAGALLLVGMAALSLVVIDRMTERMDVFDAEAQKVDLAQRMLYDVTAQSHYRAMALLTYGDESDVSAADWNAKVAAAKNDFAETLSKLEAADRDNSEFYDVLRTANDNYGSVSAEVVAAFEAEDRDRAEALHLKEHEASHAVEDLLASCGKPGVASCGPPLGEPFIDQAQAGMDKSFDEFQSDRGLLRNIVVAFSAVSVLVALLLGFLFSWAFVLPVKKMQHALAELAAGNLRQRVEVPNRDEFGTLSQDLNRTSERLAASFQRQRSLTRSLEETNASLARASEAKSRFLASVSHELRTPMNAILGFTDALLAGVDGPLNDTQKESLGWVQRGGRDLLVLINEILDLSRIEAGRLVLDCEPFDPRVLVAAVVEQHRPLAAQKGIAFDWRDDGGPAEVVLDAQRVRQILVNIVGNAFKFTDHGRVEVEIEEGADALHVVVRDTGPGIDPALHDAVFQEFGQAIDDAAGTGLGLAISRRLARAMDGDITLESWPGRGSSFHVRLPLACRPVGNDVGGPAHTGAAMDGGHLLLSVDDDPSVAPLLQKMLDRSDYTVAAVSSPRTAVAEARDLLPDAILLDLLMDERAGADILQELRADPATSAIPVIIVSVMDADEVPDLAATHLSKPLEQSALLAALAELELGGVRG